MNYFLANSNSNTLLLLDEFGSGTDPELGGALAEVFYMELYEKNCFAVITTHYTNIKILTSTLESATNACMLFDTKKLAPLFTLSIGQPGSSFTFEVAQHNGISNELIEMAKTKVSKQKLQVDALSVSLQKEKSKFKFSGEIDEEEEFKEVFKNEPNQVGTGSNASISSQNRSFAQKSICSSSRLAGIKDRVK